MQGNHRLGVNPNLLSEKVKKKIASKKKNGEMIWVDNLRQEKCGGTLHEELKSSRNRNEYGEERGCLGVEDKEQDPRLRYRSLTSLSKPKKNPAASTVHLGRKNTQKASPGRARFGKRGYWTGELEVRF